MAEFLVVLLFLGILMDLIMEKIDISTKKYPNTFVLVDDADYESLNKWKWMGLRPKRSKTMYAVRYKKRSSDSRAVVMHRFLMNPSLEIEIDHHDGNGLNNQRYNLRLCSHSQNCANRPPRRDNFCGFKGVHWELGKCKWVARIGIDGKTRTLGRFTCIVEAAKRYDKAAKARYGEFAWLNFPEKTN